MTSTATPKAAEGSFNFIYFSNADWDYNRQRPQQFATRLSQYARVLFVSPFGIRSIAFSDFTRIIRRIRSRFTHAAKASTHGNLTIYEPLFYFPFPNNRPASAINGHLLNSFLQKWMKKNHISDPLIWAGVPSTTVVSVVKLINPSFLIYDCIDNFAPMHKQQTGIMEAERFLAERAQIVFASAEELYEKMKLINDRTFLLPNAADFQLFQTAMNNDLPVPADVAHIKSPILGYMGEVAKWFDFDLIHDLALRHPDWNVVLLGRISDDTAQKILALPNVHFLGRKNHDELPSYLSKFDVCLLPFQVNSITSAVSPVKLFEYLAAGKPVVSTPLKEVMRYRDVVEIAERAKFSDAIKSALSNSADEHKLQQRLDVARNNTWDQRVNEIISILRETFEKRLAGSEAQ